jgi:DNA-binding GntR family transcriptional regulator
MESPPTGTDQLKTKYRSITDLVAESLRASIVEGKYPPGMQLKEREVALEIGVSTTPVKAALQRLSLEGLVTSVPMRGSFVASNLDTQLAEFGLIRAALEGSAAYLAACKAGDDDVARLRAQLDSMRRFTAEHDLERLIPVNAGFHEIIHEIAGNATLRQITDMVRHYDAVTRPQVLADQQQMERGLVDHEAIFAAIEARDPTEADARMRDHVLRTTDFLRGRAEQAPAPKPRRGRLPSTS